MDTDKNEDDEKKKGQFEKNLSVRLCSIDMRAFFVVVVVFSSKVRLYKEQRKDHAAS